MPPCRLRRVEAGAWPGTLRRPQLARLSSPCDAIDCRLRLPGTGAMPFPPLGQLAAHPPSRHPASPTPCATRLHAPRRYRYGPNGIIHTRSPPCAARSQPTSPAPCPDAPVASVDSYNTVVIMILAQSRPIRALANCGIGIRDRSLTQAKGLFASQGRATSGGTAIYSRSIVFDSQSWVEPLLGKGLAARGAMGRISVWPCV